MNSLFTLRSANRIANLTCGRIDAVYRDIYRSPEHFQDFLASLDYCAEMPCVSDEFHTEVQSLKDLLVSEGFLDEKTRSFDEDNKVATDPEAPAPKSDAHWQRVLVMTVLYEFSSILSEFPLKAILLPQVRYNKSDGYDDEFISSPQVLEKLVEPYRDDMTLLLQPRERPSVNRVTIFDAFPYFSIALRQVDQWPGVLFWDHENGSVAFVPVANSDELSHVFALAHGEKPFEQLNEYAQSKLPRSHYFLHLSDIHFGSKSGSRLQTQLETLVNTQVRTLDARDKIDFVVTGDHVNNPTDASVQSVRNFAEFLDTNSNDEAMFVLGNHDINRFGLALRHKNQRWQHIIGGYPKIKIIEDIGVIFMLFNSNTGGLFAQGEIGELQMQEMREQLARIKQLERYTLVAVLHHHVAAASYYAQVYGNDQWQEEVGRYRGREKLKRLRDADQFLDFLREYDTKFILHGHKHIPIVIDMDRILVIACGSSIGKNKDYLSYNMLKFSKHTLACTQFVEQKPDAKFKRQDIMAVVFDF